MTSRYFVQLSFNGTNYHGWQLQPNALSIQEVVAKTLSTILRENIEVTGAGRTDTGVHASYYIAHFDSLNNSIHEDKNIIFKLNGLLPKDIVFYKIFPVVYNANARFHAITRTYQYNMHQFKDPFINEGSVYYPKKLNIDLMNKAASELLEFADFTSFSKLHSNVKTNNCKISHASWEKNDYKLTFTITADRFLRNMVRAIVGTLIDVGNHKISLKDFVQIIENKNRSDAGISVPANGLFLTDIKYPANIFIT